MGVLVTWLVPVWARAGSVGADLSDSEVGDLRLSGVAVSKQTWTLRSDGVELELELSAATGGRIEGRLLLTAAVRSDFESWVGLLAQYPQQAPKQAEFRAAGQPLHVVQTRERVPEGDWMREELVFTLPAAHAGQHVHIS